ncbi:Serine/threonine-protein phosphatase 4 regulatory subunit 3 [Holothuria leucospilota]|uniref:Serine/threonine-protein phosphatase 4 regulatory subunit 3 n=1 Tax=Holothuria leucospilota TaxID=206669 RepID=A0A9Q1HGD5_HOLLE|nr:Serine/threonine-protein phosphatase 4 regulatory subunit 3 [Holothuria leucospilota]
MVTAEEMASTRRRVKLYVLNEERQWDDKGTGHVSYCYVDSMNGMCLLVRSETNGSMLLESKIQPDTAYQKQQETLIVWSENDNYDLALSFQEKAGCDEIWEIICQIQGKDPSVDITQDIVEESEDERFDDMPDIASPIELPACELSKLEEIAELFSGVLPSPFRREKLANALENENYISKLLDLFHICEDLENTDCLHHLYEIVKNTILLNRTSLLEIMFSEEHMDDVIGCLEYDPSATSPQKHREYLNSQANFREVLPITNQDLLNKIHQTYKVQYIQDVILPTPSVFEENMLSTVSSFIFFNKVDIVNMIQEDEKFLPELFVQLKDESTLDSRRRELVLFIKEYCSFAQSCQNRENFFQTLSNLGILQALEVVFAMDDVDTRQAAIDIFACIVEFNPSMVREFIVQEGTSQEDDNLLINLIIEQMICDTDPDLGCAVQLMNILRILIDPENMLATVAKTEKTIFLGFFYRHCMHSLTAPLLANTTEEKPSKDDYQTAQLLSLILELLTFCVEHHTYHVKNYIINKDILKRVLVLLKSSHQFLVLGALRFMRRIIGMRDDFYNRYIIKGNLFQPVVLALKSNAKKHNLLNSALIEFFEFIRIMRYGERKNPIIFGGGERSSGVTGGQTLKTPLTRYLKKGSSDGSQTWGQRSPGVTGGQTLKTLLTQYLEVGSLDEFHTLYVDALWSKVILGQRGPNTEKLVNTYLQEDIKLVVCHLGDTFDSEFDNVDYVNTFKGLKQKYEQHLDRLNSKSPAENSLRQGSILHQARYRRDARAMDEDEENWFDQEDESDDTDPVVRGVDNTFRNTRVDPELDVIGRFIGMEENDVLHKDAKATNGRSDGLVKSPLANSPTKNNQAVMSPIRNLNTSSPVRTDTPLRPGTPIVDSLTMLSKPKLHETHNTSANNSSTSQAKEGDPSTTSDVKENKIPPKGSIVGLVDYPDEDSEDEEEDEENSPPSKKPRLSV